MTTAFFEVFLPVVRFQSHATMK